MACRGVHFAIEARQAERLFAAEDDEELVGIIQEEIEEAWEVAYETDKAWDALHRCLSNGTLSSDEGEPPLNKVFFGGETLNETEAWLRKRYFDVPFPDYQGEKSEED